MLKKIFNSVFTNRYLKFLFSSLFLNKYFITKTNYIYEFSPHIFQEMFIRLAIAPDFNFYWTIYLANGKKAKVYVSKDYPPSFSFAISYKWHDLGIRKLETLLNNFYDLDYCYIDIGANHGLRSIYSLSQGRYTYLFEPNIQLNNFVLDFFRLNSFKGFKLENLCLSHTTGTMNFYLSPSSYLSSLDKENAMNDNEKGEVREVKVEVTKLDKYFENTDTKIGIIKIDVEGHEYEVLKGAGNILKTSGPDFIVEILKDSKNKMKIYRLMENHFYKCYAITNKNKLRLIKYKNENDFVDTHLANNYFFTKNEKCLSEVSILRSDKYN